MTPRNISPADLRAVSFPTGKSGYDPEKVDAVIGLCASTIESLESQIEELQRAIAIARAESSPMELATHIDDEEDAIAQWLTTLDPTEIDLEVQKNIAEAIVESTMAASHIRSEARERVKTLIDAVASEVQKLTAIIKEAKSSVAASAALPQELAKWEGEFSARISTLLQQLQLPWTVQVSQLAKVLSHMADNPADEGYAAPKKIQSRKHRTGDDHDFSIKRSKAFTDDEDEDSKTIKGSWA